MNETLLMIPGPTRVAPRVLKAMSENIVNHRSAVFGEIITETTEMMSEVFQTENQSYILTGSGTAAMEAALASVLDKGDKVLNIVGGKPFPPSSSGFSGLTGFSGSSGSGSAGSSGFTIFSPISAVTTALPIALN